MNDRYYRTPTLRVGQGDVLADVPHLRIVDSRIDFARRRATQRGPVADLYQLGDIRQPQHPIDPNDDEALARIQVGNGIVISNACDWDNTPTAPVQVALVRPLVALPRDQWDVVRQNANGRFLHMPDNNNPHFPESYVDFARVTSIRADMLAGYQRILSPTAEYLTALYAALVYFHSRMDLDEAAARAEAVRAAQEADEPP